MELEWALWILNIGFERFPSNRRNHLLQMDESLFCPWIETLRNGFVVSYREKLKVL